MRWYGIESAAGRGTRPLGGGAGWDMVPAGTHLRVAWRPDRIRASLDRHVLASAAGDREGSGGERVRDPTHADRVPYRPGRWSDPRRTVERPPWAAPSAIDGRRRVRPGFAPLRHRA